MGTGSYEEIDYRIKGRVRFDYEDKVRAYETLRLELELLCSKYGLELERKNNG